MLKISEIPFYSNYSKAVDYKNNKVAFKSKEQMLTREMEMIPMMLELAKDKKGGYRFNAPQIEKIADKFAQYVSGMSKLEFLKSLLSIGEKKGVQLESDEIMAILAQTCKFEPKGQDNILKFAGYIKERDYNEYDENFVRKHHSYEEFKKEGCEGLSEELLRTLYNEDYSKQVTLINSLVTRGMLMQKAPRLDKYFSSENNLFIKKGVAKCSEPEILAEIVLEAGVHPDTAQKAESLISAYKMSKGNMGLVLDLNRCFLLKEVNEILDTLKQLKKSDLAGYIPSSCYQVYNDYVPLTIELNSVRRQIMRELGLSGILKIKHIDNTYVDVMSGKRLDGSFEQGKRS